MNCFSCERNLSAYIDDELDTEARLALETHLDECTACRTEYERHQAAWETVGLSTVGGAPESLWQAVETELGQGQNTTSIEDLALMLRGLAGQVQDLQQSLEGLRRQIGAAGIEIEEEREGIQVSSSGPYRSGRPRESSIQQLKDNPFQQLRRS